MADLIQSLIAKFQNFDRNADGDPAIASLSYLAFESSSEDIPQDARLVLVLVEPRLLNPMPGAEDLIPILLRYKGDLRAEGLFSRFIRADVYHGQRHQDGRTLLAMRSFLREVKLSFSKLEGVILVGAFPEAPIVRRCVWKINFRDIPIGNTPTKGEYYLSIWPIVIATRAEIVLADLDGNWPLLYHEEEMQVESIAARPDAATAGTDWPVDNAVFSSTSFNRNFDTHRDFFFIDDGDYTVLSADPGPLKVFIRRQLKHPELTADDRGLPNPIARPDIFVSRINPWHVAANPDPAIHGDDGTLPLDASGFPQAFTSSQTYDTWLGFYKPDPVFERRLLRDYFDRNHQFRSGAFDDLPFRAAAVASPDFNAQDGASFLAPASAKFGPPLVTSKATVLDYVNWFKQPGVLRHIQAHSCAFNSAFGDQYDPNALEQAVGGCPFRWRHQGQTYTPSLHNQGIYADFYVHRTMWQNGVMRASGASMIIHGGCDVNSPGTPADPFSNPDYGTTFQNAEGLLFYMNGLALISRAKTFNDDPTGFPEAFARGPRTHFGDCWRAFFDHDAADPSLGMFDSEIRSKKTYSWSMIGDWTTRLRYGNGLGLLALGPGMHSGQVHADQAWIDGWNFDTQASTVRAIGDFDGDGSPEFLITSTWGIGILKHDGINWRQLLVAPNGTRFDGFLLNTADDHFGPVADFDGDGRDEILVTSAWGLGILAYSGGTLHPLLLAANGARFDGFLLNTADDHFGPVADFDGDGRDEILVTSAWGLGALAYSGGTLHPLLLAANGARFDGFLLNTADDHFGPVADFDGDGRDEILVTSAWGLGILAYSGGTLHPLLLAANGARFDGFLLNTADDHFGPVADFDGDGRDEILVTSAWGLGALAYSGGTLHPLLLAANGARFDGFLLNTADDHFGPVADFDGDGRDEILVTSAWGLGALAFRDGTFHTLLLAANGTHLGDWILEKNDCVVGAWPAAGADGRSRILIQRGSAAAHPASFPVRVRPRHAKAGAESALVSLALE